MKDPAKMNHIEWNEWVDSKFFEPLQDIISGITELDVVCARHHPDIKLAAIMDAHVKLSRKIRKMLEKLADRNQSYI